MTQNKVPLLSICVPTYNRSAKLKECLESILQSGDGYADSIELRISDNNSGDNTAAIVAEFSSAVISIVYLKQEINTGAEANFWSLWQSARGQYVWLIGDDDRIEPGAVGIVLQQIKAGRDAMILNYSRWSSDFQVCQNTQVFGPVDERFDSADRLFRRFGAEIGFVSAVVIRRSLIRGVSPSSYARLANTGFSFMYAIYVAVREAKDIVLLAVPVVKNRNVSTTSYNWDAYFISGVALVFEVLRTEGYSRFAVISAKNKVIKAYLAPKFKSRRMAGEGLGALLGSLLKHYGFCWRLWGFVLPIVVLPARFFRLLVAIASLVRPRRRHQNTLPNLGVKQ